MAKLSVATLKRAADDIRKEGRIVTRTELSNVTGYGLNSIKWAMSNIAGLHESIYAPPDPRVPHIAYSRAATRLREKGLPVTSVTLGAELKKTWKHVIHDLVTHPQWREVLGVVPSRRGALTAEAVATLQSASDAVRAEGRIVTKTRLVEKTGFSANMIKHSLTKIDGLRDYVYALPDPSVPDIALRIAADNIKSSGDIVTTATLANKLGSTREKIALILFEHPGWKEALCVVNGWEAGRIRRLPQYREVVTELFDGITPITPSQIGRKFGVTRNTIVSDLRKKPKLKSLLFLPPKPGK